MLTGMFGIRLILLIGKMVPVPAPYEVMRALTHVKIINETDGNDGFQMTFTLGKDKAADYGLLASGVLAPDSRVIIGVLLGVSPEPLIDGIIYHHQVTPGNEPGMSTLTVSGRDISAMLDLEEKSEKYNNQPDFVIVNRVLANYATFGLVPIVKPTTDVPIELQRVPWQQETDLKFLRRLARRNGFVFYIEPFTLGVSRAYWGAENRLGIPQPALTVNMGVSNVTTLDFSQDALASVSTKGTFVEPISKMSIPIPPLPSLRIPPLALMPATARRTSLMRSTANRNPAQAAVAALASEMGAPDSVKANGKLDTIRYGYVLRARRLVGVRGAGFSYDGNYKVEGVTHDIDLRTEGGKYTQDFKLSREGTGTILPVVRP